MYFNLRTNLTTSRTSRPFAWAMPCPKETVPDTASVDRCFADVKISSVLAHWGHSERVRAQNSSATELEDLKSRQSVSATSSLTAMSAMFSDPPEQAPESCQNFGHSEFAAGSLNTVLHFRTSCCGSQCLVCGGSDCPPGAQQPFFTWICVTSQWRGKLFRSALTWMGRMRSL